MIFYSPELNEIRYLESNCDDIYIQGPYESWWCPYGSWRGGDGFGFVAWYCVGVL